MTGGRDLERRSFVVANLIDYQAAHGVLPRRVVSAAACRLGVATRTVYRWVERGEVAAKTRPRYVPDDVAIDLYFAARGSVADVHRELLARGSNPPSIRTLRRAFAFALSPAERAYAVEGVEGFRRKSVYLRVEQTRRNELWQMDHYEIPVWVSVPRRTRPEKPWLTVVIDGYSRAVPGYSISLQQPSQAEVFATLRSAVLMREPGAVGGIPEAILWDNGREFLSDSVADAVVELGCYCSPTAAYSPHQKGKVEAFFNTVEKEFCRKLPFYTGGPRSANGDLQGSGGFLSLEELVAQFDVWHRRYNEERLHSAHGMTPAERWRTSPHAVREIAEEKLRHFLVARESRHVRKSGIRFKGLDYFATELQGLVDEQVEIRFEPHNTSTIWVYWDGEFLCEAVPHAELSPEVRRSHLGKRRQQQQRAAQLRRRSDRIARAGRIKPMTAPGLVEDTISPVAVERSTKRPQLSEDEMLEIWGIEGVNEAVDADGKRW